MDKVECEKFLMNSQQLLLLEIAFEGFVQTLLQIGTRGYGENACGGNQRSQRFGAEVVL
jgi:hypothetical protein